MGRRLAVGLWMRRSALSQVGDLAGKVGYGRSNYAGDRAHGIWTVLPPSPNDPQQEVVHIDPDTGRPTRSRASRQAGWASTRRRRTFCFMARSSS
jgi:hypothetical protein